MDQRRRAPIGLTAVGAIVALLLTGVGPATAAENIPGAPVIDIVDTDASYKTNSLFKYLQDQQGKGVLFGHQHTIDNGVTFTEADGVKSDVFEGTGEYPAVFGWDTLSLEGLGPGTGTLEANGDANALSLAKGMVQAHALGGINTLSAHMKNFATGNNFNDSSGGTVGKILAGGKVQADFNSYLDLIAKTADLTVDEYGEPIPVIFRPFHENSGSWFWWGAGHTTAGEYKELFRYTVEYLRDVKGVDNLLYAYSPNGSFGGDSSRYLATYPGDDWVDILGYDAYEYSNDSENSDAWIKSVVDDLGMVNDLAVDHGKIAALTEFGRNSDRTIKPSGNKSLNYYTDLIKAIHADPKASRIAYMLTWANWGLDQFYVPYPAYGDSPAHEMFADFHDFFEDPFTVFSGGTTGAFNHDANAEAAKPAIRFFSPADGVRISTPATTVRVKATAEAPERVYFTVAGAAKKHELVLTNDGYFTGEWEIGSENLTNSESTLTAVAVYADDSTTEATSTVVLGGVPDLANGVFDDFEGYGSDPALRSAYTFSNAGPELISLATAPVGGGKNAITMNYNFTPGSYAGFGKSFPSAQDWSEFTQIDAWVDPDASNQKLVLQFNAGGAIFEAYPSLAGDAAENLHISFSEFKNKADVSMSPTPEQLKSVTQFYVYMNEVGGKAISGSIGLDEIRAVNGSTVPEVPVVPVVPETPEVPALPSEAPSVSPVAAGNESLTTDLEDRITLSDSTVVPGQTITATLGDSSVGTFVSAFLYSAPIDLGGWQIVDPNAQIRLTIPTSTSIGEHRIAVQNTNGDVLGWAALSVIAAGTTESDTNAAANSGQLASTGVNSGFPSLKVSGLLLLLAGCALIVLRRRRGTVR
ncbi:glycosyl hydrolase [Arthrobacter psychrochitiniphilus]|uniref:glycosyl hydrolase n=1 Tax=Arthrobacter psychrochitiniphilus TaxID=291045 RepID=UPI003F7C986D